MKKQCKNNTLPTFEAIRKAVIESVYTRAEY